MSEVAGRGLGNVARKVCGPKILPGAQGELLPQGWIGEHCRRRDRAAIGHRRRARTNRGTARAARQKPRREACDLPPDGRALGRPVAARRAGTPHPAAFRSTGPRHGRAAGAGREITSLGPFSASRRYSLISCPGISLGNSALSRSLAESASAGRPRPLSASTLTFNASPSSAVDRRMESAKRSASLW